MRSDKRPLVLVIRSYLDSFTGYQMPPDTYQAFLAVFFIWSYSLRLFVLLAEYVFTKKMICVFT